MRVVVQRVSSARVEVSGKITGEIGIGLLVLAGFEASDSESDLTWVAAKLAKLRLFPDEAGTMNLSIDDVAGEVLLISQFTLFASVKKGNRPSWSQAAPSEISQPLFVQFAAHLEHALGKKIATGIFGADMQVHLINDGPVTITIDSHAP